MKLANVIAPCSDPQTRVDITVTRGIVQSIEPTETPITGPPKLLLPSLCHPHIHLDKPYILTCNSGASHPGSSQSLHCPDYSDLDPKTGDFQEALTNTSVAKSRYTSEDLYLRGAQLLATSYKQGVTHARAFVEVDHAVGLKTVEVGVKLKLDFAHLVQVQLCIFAQDPIESGPNGSKNKELILEALAANAADLEVLGTTPYVEQDRDAALANIRWAVETALGLGLHLDFHIEYDLDKAKPLEQSLTYAVIGELERSRWVERANASKTVVLGHGTRLTVLDKQALESLSNRISSGKLPVHLVGLPTSDLFMMGRKQGSAPSSGTPYLERPRATLPIPSLLREGFSGCLGVNNVGNAFTPYGTGDPLALASWGVGLYHAGTIEDAGLLYSCVSWRARRAIGLGYEDEPAGPSKNQKWRPMLLIANKSTIEVPAAASEETGLPDSKHTIKIPARQRLSVKDIVWDTPDVELRSIVS